MKILCVCGLGMGSSLILKMNVEEVLKAEGVTAEVEHSDVSSAMSERCDYVLTTTELAKSMHGTVGKILICDNFIEKEAIKAVLANGGVIN